MEEITDYFEKFGLTQYESAALTVIYSHPNSVAENIADEAGIPYTKVYAILNALEKRGFLKTTLERPKKYMSVSPQTALDILVKAKQNELNYLSEIRTGCEKKLDDVYKKGEALNSDEKVIYLPSKEAVWDQVHEYIRTAKSSIHAIATEKAWQHIFQDKKFTSLVNKFNARGGKCKIIIPKDMKFENYFSNISLDAVKFLIHPNNSFKVFTELRIQPNIMVVDNEKIGMAFLDAGTQEIINGIIICDKPTVGGYADYFKIMWENSDNLGKAGFDKLKEKLGGKQWKK